MCPIIHFPVPPPKHTYSPTSYQRAPPRLLTERRSPQVPSFFSIVKTWTLRPSSVLLTLEHPEKAPSSRIQWRVFRKQLLRTTSISCGWQRRATNTLDSSAGGQEPRQRPPEAPGMMPWARVRILIWVEETLWGY